MSLRQTFLPGRFVADEYFKPCERYEISGLGRGFELSLKLSDPGLERGDGLVDFGRGVAGSDVLRAVPIEADDFDFEEALGDFYQVRFGELLHQIRVFPRVEDFGVAGLLRAKRQEILKRAHAIMEMTRFSLEDTARLLR